MRRYQIEIKDKQYTIDVQEMEANRFRVILGDQSFEVSLSSAEDVAEAEITPAIVPNHRTHDEVAIERPAATYHPPALETMERTMNVPIPKLPPTARTPSEGFRSDLIAPMPGTILAVNVQPGDSVKRGQTLLILEAMKMKNAIKSPHDGIVSQVLAQAGQSVRYGDVLVCFEEPK